MDNQDTKANEWQFCPYMIIASEPFMQFIDGSMEADAKNGKGLFSNVTNIPKEDEFEDEFLMINAFSLQCSFVPFVDELKQYNVIGGFMNDEFKKCLLVVLKKEATFIKDNTDAPAKVKNHITNTIKKFDKIPIWGLFFQILTLQGLCRWLEEININESDNGYKEVQSLYDWLSKRLLEKITSFCFVPYGENDKKQLNPFCDYLYSTELGKMVQEKLLKKYQPEATPEQIEAQEKYYETEEYKEFKEIIFELLFDAYEQSDYGAQLTIETKIKENEFVGICKEKTLSDLLKSNRDEVTNSKYLLNTAIRTYKFTIFDKLPDVEKTIETYIDFLATVITPFYFEDYENKLKSEEYKKLSNELKYELWKSNLFEDFWATFECYKTIELLSTEIYHEQESQIQQKQKSLENGISAQSDEIKSPHETENSQIKNTAPYFDSVNFQNFYCYCIKNKNVFDGDIITLQDFINAVLDANFARIHEEDGTKKSKCKYIIYRLKELISEPYNKEWYLAAAHSIDTEPCKCSGANVPKKWKKEANAIK